MKSFKKDIALLPMVFMLGACSVVQGMRDDIDEEYPNKQKIANEFNYKAPENRNLPPPPATVNDDRIAAIQGTPIDYSGLRAKSGRVTKTDFLNESVKNENSLWSEDGQNNYLFARNKLKSSGDLVTVKIDDGLRNDMVLEVKKMLPPEFRDRDVIVPGVTKDLPKTDDATGRAVASANAATTTLSSEPNTTADTMTAEIVERYPNGNVRLRGVKPIPFKKKTRNMDMVAIVKGSDIDENDTVSSSKFLERKVELYK